MSFYADNFTAADNTAITSHSSDSGATYSEISGGTPIIVANRLLLKGGITKCSAIPPGSSYSVTATVFLAGTLADTHAAICARMSSDGLDYYAASFINGGAQIYRFLGGSAVLIGGGAPSPAWVNGETHTMTLRCLGSTISVEFDGVEAGRVTDSSISTSGSVGFWGGNGGVDATHGLHFDDITAATGGSALNGADATFASATPTSISITATAPSGGVAPYTTQWHRSTTVDFTPDGSTLLAGETSANLTDSTVTGGVLYFYKQAVADSAAGTAVSNQVIARTEKLPIQIGVIGDSLSYANSFPTKLQTAYQALEPSTVVTVDGQAIAGSTTAQWLPGAGTGYFTAALASFVSAGVTIVSMMHGANDAGAGVAGATESANIAAIVTELLNGHGIDFVVLHYLTAVDPAVLAAGRMNNCIAYHPFTLALTNGTDTLLGDTDAWAYFLEHPTQLSDGLHPTDTGSSALAEFHATAIFRAVRGIVVGGSGGGINGSAILGML